MRNLLSIAAIAVLIPAAAAVGTPESDAPLWATLPLGLAMMAAILALPGGLIWPKIVPFSGGYRARAFGISLAGSFASSLSLGLVLEKYEPKVATINPVPVAIEAITAAQVAATPPPLPTPRPDFMVQAKPSTYRQIDVDDLKVDKNQMIGRKVSVSGLVQVLGETAMLKSGLMDMSPIFVDISSLPRSDRKTLLSGCNMGCQVSIDGHVGKTMMQTGIIAESITIN
jgi:hypothetical protein